MLGTANTAPGEQHRPILPGKIQIPESPEEMDAFIEAATQVIIDELKTVGKPAEGTPQHRSVVTVLPDGRHLSASYVDLWDGTGRGQVAPNALFRIAVRPNRNDQFGWDSTADGGLHKLTSLRLLLGKSDFSGDDIVPLFSDRGTNTDGGPNKNPHAKQYAQLLALVLSEIHEGRFKNMNRVNAVPGSATTREDVGTALEGVIC